MTVQPSALPIVLVHGFIGHLQSVGRHGDTGLFAPDLLGYGRFRDYAASAINVSAQVDHVMDQIDRAVGNARVLVVAHSAGATIAIRLAQLHPSRIAALLIAEGNLAASDAFLAARLGPMSLPDVQDWLGRMRDDPARLLRADGVPITEVNLTRMGDWLRYQDAAALHQMARSILLETVTPNYELAVSKVMRQTPTGLIFGARSPHKRLLAEPVRSAIVSSSVIADSGHLLPLEAPERFREEIDRFAARCLDQTATGALIAGYGS